MWNQFYSNLEHVFVRAQLECTDRQTGSKTLPDLQTCQRKVIYKVSPECFSWHETCCIEIGKMTSLSGVWLQTSVLTFPFHCSSIWQRASPVINYILYVSCGLCNIICLVCVSVCLLSPEGSGEKQGGMRTLMWGATCKQKSVFLLSLQKSFPCRSHRAAAIFLRTTWRYPDLLWVRSAGVQPKKPGDTSRLRDGEVYPMCRVAQRGTPIHRRIYPPWLEGAPTDRGLPELSAKS